MRLLVKSSMILSLLKIDYKAFMFFAALMLPLTPFTKELGQVQVLNFWVDAISHTFFVLSFIFFFFYKKLYISKTELIIFSSILLVSLLNTIFFELSIIIVFKQFLPIFILYFVSKTIIEEKGPEYIIEKYVNVAVFAAIIGFLQLVLKFLGIEFLTPDLQLNLDSLAYEPSHYVVMTLPALIYLYEKKCYSLKFFTILLSLIFTFKTTFMVSVFGYLVLTNIKFNIKALYTFLTIFTIGAIMVIFVSEVQSRFMNFIQFLLYRDISNLLNLTVYSYVSNLHVAITNFVDTYGFGIGLGGHDATYYRNLQLYIESPYNNKFLGFNSMSAHSLLVRVISELGILGILLWSILFIKSIKIKQNNLRIIALASCSAFIARFFKIGSYFEYGAILFLVLMIVSIKLDEERHNKMVSDKT